LKYRKNGQKEAERQELFAIKSETLIATFDETTDWQSSSLLLLPPLHHHLLAVVFKLDLSMSCNPTGFNLHHQHHPSAAMKPLMLAKDEPDCDGGDHVSESNYDDGQHHAVYKSSLSGIGSVDDVDSDNEASNDQQQHHHALAHHLRSSGVKLEAALMEFNEGLNLINKPNSNTNDDNNNTSSSYNSATTSNDNNNNNTSNSVKGSSNSDGINKTPRKLFECDVCNVSIVLRLAIFAAFSGIVPTLNEWSTFHCLTCIRRAD